MDHKWVFPTQMWADTSASREHKEHLHYVHGPLFLSFDDAAGCYCKAKGQSIFIVKKHNEFVKDDDVTV